MVTNGLCFPFDNFNSIFFWIFKCRTTCIVNSLTAVGNDLESTDIALFSRWTKKLANSSGSGTTGKADPLVIFVAPTHVWLLEIIGF